MEVRGRTHVLGGGGAPLFPALQVTTGHKAFIGVGGHKRNPHRDLLALFSLFPGLNCLLNGD